MGVEIERKFIVQSDDWYKSQRGIPICQGYLCVTEQVEVRVRTRGSKGYVTVKCQSAGTTRSEYEYEIPVVDAEVMLREFCQSRLIRKTRYAVMKAGLKWEVDVFAGDNTGLVLAEVELVDENQNIEIPHWLGKEVTDDPRYRNAYLAKNAFSTWVTPVRDSVAVDDEDRSGC